MADIPRSKVVVSRKWNSPQIEVYISKGGVGASMELDSFLEAVALAMDHPAMAMTRTQITKRMKSASVIVLTEMKDQTVHVA